MLIFYLIGGLIAVVMLVTFIRSGSFFRNFLSSAATGLTGLAASWGVGLLGFNLISLNLFSVLTAIVLGLPGVIGLMLARLMVL